MGMGQTVRQNFPTPLSRAPLRASKASSFGVAMGKYAIMEAQASTVEGEGRQKRQGPRKDFFGPISTKTHSAGRPAWFGGRFFLLVGPPHAPL
jgi:hypothetical protein